MVYFSTVFAVNKQLRTTSAFLHSCSTTVGFGLLDQLVSFGILICLLLRFVLVCCFIASIRDGYVLSEGLRRRVYYLLW